MALSGGELMAWAGGMIGYFTLLGVLYAKRRYRQLPLFSSLIVFQASQSILLIAIHQLSSAHTYALAYWIAELIDAALRIAVMFEIGRLTAKAAREKVSWHSRLITWLGVCAFLTCLAVLFCVPNSHTALATFALKTSVCTSALGGILVIGFLMLTFFEGVRVRVHAQSVVCGMAVFFTGRLLTELFMLMGEQGLWMTFHNNLLKPIYIICLLAWTVLFWLEEPERQVTRELHRFMWRSIAWQSIGVALRPLNRWLCRKSSPDARSLRLRSNASRSIEATRRTSLQWRSLFVEVKGH